MTLDQALNTICRSTAEDWYRLDPNTPFYKLRVIMNGNAPDIDQHLEFVAYKPDISITVGFDLLENDDFQAAFANNNANTESKGMWLDVFYNDGHVFRLKYFSADGGRVYMPIPELNNGRWEVPNDLADFMFTFNEILGMARARYDAYLQANGIVVVNDRWDY